MKLAAREYAWVFGGPSSVEEDHRPGREYQVRSFVHHTRVETGHRGELGVPSRNGRRSRLRVLLAVPTVVAVAALAGSVSAAPASAFIMKDGNICDPIRHIGC